jgi:hypothetical protein
MAVLHESKYEFYCPNCGKQTAQRNEDSDVDSHSDNKKEKTEKSESWNMSVSKTLKYGGLAVAGACAIPMVAGFGTAGIVGGSLAAITQSSIGNIVAGSAFSILQSLGATGVFAAGTAAGGSAAGAGYISERLSKHKKTSEENEPNNDETEELLEISREEAVAAKGIKMRCPFCDCVFEVKHSEHISEPQQ